MPKAREWTQRERDTVARLTAQGIGTREIARVLNTSPKTLRRHFGDMLKAARSGHRPVEWSQQQRDMVQAMTGFGLTQEQIAGLLKISKDQLVSGFREELDTGSALANARVASSLFQMATTGGVPSAAIFWLKSRAGWVEQFRVQHAGKVGHEHTGEIDVKHDVRQAVGQLDKSGREKLRDVLTQLGARSGLSDEGPSESDPLH